MSRSLGGAPCREETGWPVGEMIVVVEFVSRTNAGFFFNHILTSSIDNFAPSLEKYIPAMIQTITNNDVRRLFESFK